MAKEIEIPESYEARIEGNKVIIEPKESKDEKIRKELIEELKSKLPFCSEEFTKHRIIRQIAYLEKQKEQKPTEGITHAEIEQAMDEVTKFKVFAADMAKRFNITHRRDIDWHNFCAGLLTYLKVNQPAEWSEEDKKTIDSAIFWLNNTLGNSIDRCFPDKEELSLKTTIDRLKSLHPQPKQEWSEEDKEYLAACIDVIDNFYTLSGELKTLTKINVLRREYAEKLKSWLKSLRPQPKQEWSKEDENILNIVLGIILYDSKRQFCEGHQIYACWLNALVDKFKHCVCTE